VGFLCLERVFWLWKHLSIGVVAGDDGDGETGDLLFLQRAVYEVIEG